MAIPAPGRCVAPAAAHRPEVVRRVRLIVAPSEHGQLLRALLTDRGGLSGNDFDRALRAGGITVNRRRASQADLVLQQRDEVVAYLEEKGRRAGEPPVLDAARILLLDDRIVCVDKPPGIPAQGTAVDAFAGLDSAVSALFKTMKERNTFAGIVHRLDLETSGVTVFGRTPEAVRFLSAQVRSGRFDKRYLAIVSGHPSWDETVVDAPLGPSPVRRGLRAVRPGKDPSLTRFRCLERFGEGPTAFSWIEARPETGRTHQIRVHAAHVGLPLAGDRRYGGPAFITRQDGVRISFPRVALHASSLSFPHPNGKRVRAEAPWPADLDEVVTRLRALDRG